MSDVDEGRSAETRARAERALVLLVYEIGDEDAPLIVLGGLVPEVLTRDEGAVIPQHLGTTDVDVLLITQLDADTDLGGVERALKRLEFGPYGETWRWRDRNNERPVKIEFLCDLEGWPEGEVISPAGCSELAAVNLRGTGFVARDWAWEELSATSYLPRINPVGRWVGRRSCWRAKRGRGSVRVCLGASGPRVPLPGFPVLGCHSRVA